MALRGLNKLFEPTLPVSQTTSLPESPCMTVVNREQIECNIAPSHIQPRRTKEDDGRHIISMLHRKTERRQPGVCPCFSVPSRPDQSLGNNHTCHCHCNRPGIVVSTRIDRSVIPCVPTPQVNTSTKFGGYLSHRRGFHHVSTQHTMHTCEYKKKRPTC